MEVGCLRHPENIGRQLVDGDCSHGIGWEILEPSNEHPRGRGDSPPLTLNQQWKGRGRGGRMLEDVLSCKTTFAVNAVAVKAANTSQSKRTSNPGACAYQNTASNYNLTLVFSLFRQHLYSCLQLHSVWPSWTAVWSVMYLCSDTKLLWEVLSMQHWL